MLEIFYFRVCLNSLINFKDMKNCFSQFFKYLFNPLIILLIFVYFHHFLTLLKSLNLFCDLFVFIIFLFFFNFHINFISFTKITSASWFDIFNSNFTNKLVDFLWMQALLLIFSSIFILSSEFSLK